MKVTLKAFFVVLVTLASVQAAAQVIGRVMVAAGPVTLVRQGAPLQVTTGTGLQVGDTLVTGAAANAQLRFTDNSIVALRESSRFLVEQYRFEAGSPNNSLTFALLKGGIRTLTGAIGATRRAEEYRVRTPIASVGIRGTQYALLYCDSDCTNDDGTLAANGAYGGVFDGRVGVFNNAGDVEFGRDEYFFVPDINTIPQPLLGPPSFLADRLPGMAKVASRAANDPAPRDAAVAPAAAAEVAAVVPPVTGFTSTDTRGAGGGPVVAGAVAANQFFALSYSLIEDGGPQEAATYGASLALPSNLSMITTAGSGPSAILTGFTLQPLADRTGAVGPSGIDMQGFDPASGAAWGRWRDGTVNVGSPDEFLAPGVQTPGTGVHYMIGAVPTSDAVLAAKTGTATFNDFAGTTPTDSTGQVANSFTFGPINVNFTARTANVTSINLSFPTSSWSYSNVPMSITTAASSLNHVGAFIYNVGSCVGACGGSTGNNATIDITGVFLGGSGNFLGMTMQGFSGANLTTNHLAWGSVRLFRCPTCP